MRNINLISSAVQANAEQAGAVQSGAVQAGNNVPPVNNKIFLVDTRKVDAVNGKPILENNKLNYTVDYNLVKGIIDEAKRNNVDPYTALAISTQETGLGTTGNKLQNGRATFHLNPTVYKVNATNDPKLGIKAVVDQLNYAKSLQQRKVIGSDEASYLQSFGGYGTIKRGHPDLEGATSIYGVEIPPQGLNQKENPMYGKRIIDIRENILKKTPAIVKLVEGK